MAEGVVRITADTAPPLGDLREAGAGLVIVIRNDAPTREDWPRYVEAIGAAVGKGADAVWIR